MSRCIHLLLDFYKETDDHKSLLDLAIQLKFTPDLDKYEKNYNFQCLLKLIINLNVLNI